MLRISATLFLTVTSLPASVIFGLPIVDSAEGWVCNPAPGGMCPGANNGATSNGSYVAGFVESLNAQFRDWFEFAIPDRSFAPFDSAILFLSENTEGHAGGALTYGVYGLSGLR